MGYLNPMWRRFYDAFTGKILNKRWKQSEVFYRYDGSSPRLVKDVLRLNKSQEQALLGIASTLQKTYKVSRYDDDAIVEAIMKWKSDKYPNSRYYVTDRKNYGRIEYWQKDPLVTLRRGGDCDDWLIVMMHMMRLLGIPAYRRKGKACTVFNPDGTYAGGHANIIYLSRENQEWYTVETTFHEDKALENFNILPEKENLMYPKERIWFTFNEEYSWSPQDFELPENWREFYRKVE